MRDRNEATPEAAGTGLVPIGLLEVLRIVPVLFFRKPRNHSWLPYRTKKMMAWEPIEFHRFWRRMLGEDEG